MTISQKIKTIDSRIEQNKVQNNLDRKTAKIFALLSGNVGKYEFLIRKYVLPEKDLLEKAATKFSKKKGVGWLGGEGWLYRTLIKEVDKQKCFPVITKNSNQEILTKNLVIFKR